MPAVRRLALALTLGALLAPAVAPAKLPPALLDQLPAPASQPVDFARDIHPILDVSCAKCHARGKAKGGFRIDDRQALLEPADSGPAVLPGNSRDSYLIHLVSGLDPDFVMPDKGTRLTPAEVGLLRAWIDQGAPWDPAISFAREPHRNLKRRLPDLPQSPAHVSHPVDRILTPYFARLGFNPPSPVDDRTFARRAYLDVVGLLPTPAELQAFLDNPNPDRRERLVDQLLADNPRYAQHALSFWNDLLRNDYRGTGYIDGGREQITPWLYAALRDNKPYDAFVRELINPGDGPAKGFTKGIVWRGAINASQTPQMQAAQNIGQVFFGVNLKCASCHDSFIDDWQLADAYGMAGIYADDKLEMVQCDKPLGQHAAVRFLFPELGTIDDNAPRNERIARLAELATHPDNGRLSRTLVNRLWALYLGRGLVEPLDVMQNPAWNPDLLDWLAEDLATHAYDIKRTIRLILTSQAYQLPAVDVPDQPAADFAFRGPAVRRLSAEQFRDALAQLTGVWHDKPEGNLDSLLFEKGSAHALPANAAWVWSDAHAAQAAPPQTIHLRKTFTLPSTPADAIAFIHADNAHRLWVNGRSARKVNDIPWNETSIVDISPFLQPGTNVFALEATNGGDSPNPAGVLFYARLRPKAHDPASPHTPAPPDDPGPVWDLGSDASWRVSTQRTEGWHKPDFDDASWPQAQILGPAGMAPWNVGHRFAEAIHGRAAFGNVRTALVSADPLTLALGRPNREQVTSSRPTTATTLQMLELTNGKTFANLLRQGATRLARESTHTPATVDQIFRQGLGRPPTPTESSIAASLLGSPARPEGVEDLLWSVAMLPEFQLIH
jgi:mono/diheme cytochrome c family protein